MDKIYVYIKKRDNLEIIKPLILKASHGREDDYDLYTDVDRDYLAYKQMKKDALNKKGILIISSIKIIGSNNTEIYKELLWFKKNNLEVVFADYPATHIFENKLANEIALNVMIDVYGSLINEKAIDNRNDKSTKAGRKKINFPDNWSELYERWERSEITAKEFMHLSNLKKGTFYHLVTEYRELLELNKDILKMG